MQKFVPPCFLIEILFYNLIAEQYCMVFQGIPKTQHCFLTKKKLQHDLNVSSKVYIPIEYLVGFKGYTNFCTQPYTT